MVEHFGLIHRTRIFFAIGLDEIRSPLSLWIWCSCLSRASPPAQWRAPYGPYWTCCTGKEAAMWPSNIFLRTIKATENLRNPYQNIPWGRCFYRWQGDEEQDSLSSLTAGDKSLSAQALGLSCPSPPCSIPCSSKSSRLNFQTDMYHPSFVTHLKTF